MKSDYTPPPLQHYSSVSRMSVLVFLDVNQYFSDILYNYMTRCTFIINNDHQNLTVLKCNDSSVTFLNFFCQHFMILTTLCNNVFIKFNKNISLLAKCGLFCCSYIVVISGAYIKFEFADLKCNRGVLCYVFVGNSRQGRQLDFCVNKQ